jgi:SAM-dependent methyltransferase
VPITHENFIKAKQGDWNVLLTPTKPVPKEWFPDFPGCKILGLASGGGQQMPVFAALGAECTVLDYSKKQIKSEKLVAEREGYPIRTVRTDMTKPLPFDDNSFDFIFHPVANCYIEHVIPVWKECCRILKKGGILMAGLDNGINFIFDDTETILTHSLPFNPIINPELQKELDKTDDGVQFSHTLEEQIRGQIQSGFSIKDLYEDYNGYGPLHEHGIPTFWATLAVKK